MTLITGGSKCGKSSLAEKLLDRYGDNKYYIATMQPFGEEALAAIDRHRKLRAGKGFVTIERYTGLAELDIPSGSAPLCGLSSLNSILTFSIILQRTLLSFLSFFLSLYRERKKKSSAKERII